MGREEALVEVENLAMYFPITAGVMRRKIAEIKAVDGISFYIRRGETLGLVGESGCGKSTIGRCLLQLHRITKGKIFFEGKDLSQFRGRKLRQMRRHMQMIFQDTYTSFNPRMTTGDVIGEPILAHNLAEGNQYWEQVLELLRLVELEPRMALRYPHEFSSGQRQRIGVARALALRPSFIVCDLHPVVTVQASMVDLLERLQAELSLTYLFISRDLPVARHISNRVAVMYLGKIIEIRNSDELYDSPLHPYTQALLSAYPVPDLVIERQRQRIQLTGDVPNPVNPPSGCHFHPRCFMVIDMCKEQVPELRDIGGEHWVACHRV